MSTAWLRSKKTAEEFFKTKDKVAHPAFMSDTDKEVQMHRLAQQQSSFAGEVERYRQAQQQAAMSMQQQAEMAGQQLQRPYSVRNVYDNELYYHDMQIFGREHAPGCLGLHSASGKCMVSGGPPQYHKPITIKTEPPKPTKEKTMFTEIKADLHTFLRNHKGLIYAVIGLFLVDHFMFEGKFKQRLQQMMHNMVNGVEKKIEQMGQPNEKQ